MHDGLYYLDKDISPAVATVLSPSRVSAPTSSTRPYLLCNTRSALS
jgi:hypothetical protein